MKHAAHSTEIRHSDNSAQKASMVAENLGWLDRLLRFIIATAFLSVSATYLFLGSGTPTWLKEGAPMVWPYYLMIIAIYPMVTAILGRDPIYGLLGIRSCGDSLKNPCGTFPFEVDAALGHNPIPNSKIEHSLSASHHEKRAQSKT